MDQHAIESLEKATLAAVPPREVETLDGWLLALDAGTVGRAHSAVPMRHERIDALVVTAIEQRYSERGLNAVFRLPQAAAFDGVREALLARGYASTQPTLTMVGQASAAARLPASHATVELTTEATDDWSAVYLGADFDPVDGACRVGLLRRSRDSLFAGVRMKGQMVAVGCGCFAEGWWGVHGMRTAAAWRGRGFAASILAALAREAGRRGIARAFLQVESSNAAQSIYRRAGFADAWNYDYWRRR